MLPDLLTAPGVRAGAIVAETGRGTLTLDALEAQAARWAGLLGARGIGRGAVVVVQTDDALRLLPALFGIWIAGAAAVPLDRSRPEREVLRAAAESRAELMVVESDSTISTGAPRLQSHLPEAPWRSTPACRPRDPALLLYTSGTTGPPKCVVFSHRAMVANVRAVIAAAGLASDEIICTPMAPALPAVLATCLLPAVALGARALLPGRFLPAQTVRLLAERRATTLFAVPYLYELLCDSPSSRRSLPALRRCVTSSAALRVDLAARFLERTGVPIRTSYCSSEAGAVTYNDASDATPLLRSVGRPLPGVQIEIRDAADRPLPTGEVGEVVVGGRLVASGYWRQPALQRRVFRRGWVRTGDLGRFDDAGYLYLAGRLSETINVAGSLVNPIEVEEILRLHPSVRDALVRAAPDPDAGEVPVALVVTPGGLDEATLRAHCAAHLASYKIPRRFRAVQSLSRGRMGKVRRQTAGS